MPPELRRLIIETRRQVRILKRECADIAEYLVFLHKPKLYVAHHRMRADAANANIK